MAVPIESCALYGHTRLVTVLKEQACDGGKDMSGGTGFCQLEKTMGCLCQLMYSLDYFGGLPLIGVDFFVLMDRGTKSE